MHYITLPYYKTFTPFLPLVRYIIFERAHCAVLYVDVYSFSLFDDSVFYSAKPVINECFCEVIILSWLHVICHIGEYHTVLTPVVGISLLTGKLIHRLMPISLFHICQLFSCNDVEQAVSVRTVCYCHTDFLLS